MEYKIFNSELKLLELLWDNGKMAAKDIAVQAKEQVGWSKTTTYTVLKKCVEKGLIEREEPGFLCRAIVTREEAQKRETQSLIDRMYDGKADLLVASLLEGEVLSADGIERLRRLVEELK